MFLSNNGEKIEKYRFLTSEKTVNAAPLKWNFKKMARDFFVKLIENVQQ